MSRQRLDDEHRYAEVSGTVRVTLICKPGTQATLERSHKGSWSVLCEARGQFAAHKQKVVEFGCKRETVRLQGQGAVAMIVDGDDFQPIK